MNIFNLPNTLVIESQLERHSGKQTTEQPCSKIFNTAQSTINMVKPAIEIIFNLVPLEEICHAQRQSMLHLTVKIRQQIEDIHVRYLKRRVVEVASETKSIKSGAYEVSLMNDNNVTIAIGTNLNVMEGDTIKVCLAVCQSKPNFKGKIGNICEMVKITNKIVMKIPSISHPIEIVEIPEGITISKKRHKIPKLRDGPKVLVCHDMKNGYLEDVNQYSVISQLHNYRFNHWGITDIFVYFSHFNIAIPPKCWVDVCHSYNKVCLATFIIEDGTCFTTKQVSDYLVHLACQLGFDGYLMNIEYPVKDVEALKKWLGQLKEDLHKALPGSILVFYDAIIHSGELRYQSQLNQNNIDFLNLSDYFFTDYHWNMDRLETGCGYAMSIDRLADVFVGNDIFGRGTYGGGQLNTYKSVFEARKLGFSIALFAQAFSYEVLGKTIEHFTLADDALFFGKSTETTKAQDQKWTITINKGNGWKKQGQEWVTSFDTCQRQWVQTVSNKYKNQGASIYFNVQVKGTPPKVNDPYRLLIQLFAQGGKLLTSTATKKKEATENWQVITIEIPLLALGASAKELQYVRVTQMGQDREGWGGHYGTRFKNQSLVFSLYQPDTDLSKIVGTIPIDILPFHSYYSVGLGTSIFLDGKSTVKMTNQKQSYNNMKDYDLPYQNKSLNTAIKTKVSYDAAWTGGSSLFVKCTQKDCTYGILQLLNVTIKQPTHVMLKIKETQKHKYILVCSATCRKEPSIVDVGSGWIQLSFDVEAAQNLSLEILCPGEDQGVFIGQLLVVTHQNMKIPQKQKKTYVVTIRQSVWLSDLEHTYVDLLVKEEEYSDDVIADSLVPFIKSTLVLLNGQYVYSLYRQAVNFIEKLRVDDLKNNKVEIISVDRLGRQTSHNVMIYIL